MQRSLPVLKATAEKVLFEGDHPKFRLGTEAVWLELVC